MHGFFRDELHNATNFSFTGKFNATIVAIIATITNNKLLTRSTNNTHRYTESQIYPSNFLRNKHGRHRMNMKILEKSKTILL